MNSGTITVTNSIISGNTTADSGGGITSVGTSLPPANQMTIIGSLISKNTAARSGGGIHGNGKMTIFLSTISNNTAEDVSNNQPSPVGGGGISDYNGIYSGRSVIATYNCISGNSDISVTGVEGAPAQSFVGNWWGAVNGPIVWEWDGVNQRWIKSSGSGDSVLKDTVSFQPWLSAPPFNCSDPPSVSSPDPTPGADLSVDHIEVAQVLLADYDPADNKEIPLIAGKPTLVRVYVNGATSVPFVSARLYVQDAQGQHAYDGLLIGAKSIPSLDDLNSTINFYFLPPQNSLTGNVTFRVEVDPFNIVAESNETDNGFGPITRPFQSAKTLEIAYVPIHYDPSTCNWPNKDPNAFRTFWAYLWAQKVYPLAKIEYFPWPKMEWRRPLRNESSCLGNRDFELEKPLLSSLSLRWFLLWPFRPDFVFGWLPDEAVGGGNSDPDWPEKKGSGVAAHGDDDPVIGQRIFAHEIGHLLGGRHTKAGAPGSCGNPTPLAWSDWPYDDATIQKWGLDISLAPSPDALKKSYEYTDYMSYCWPSYMPPWTSPHTYKKIYEKLKTQTTPLAPQAIIVPPAYFFASGLIFTNNTAVLDPIWIVNSLWVPPVPSSTGTQYCLEAQNASGVALVSHCFDLAFVNYETGEATDVDGFNAMFLPYPSGVTRIVLKKGSQELAVRSVSAHAPVVTVLSPNGGENWAASGNQTITWNGSDVDGDSLTYSVLYSPDGSNWVPVGAAITGTQLLVNVAELAGGSGAKIRVLATDGVNTSSDDSNAPFTVGRKGPQVHILSPEEDETTIPPNTPLILQGYAYDLEDGILGDTMLRWSSNRDGDLGTGSYVLALLSQGRHVITLTGADSNGNTATATINVSVEYKKIYLPIILKNG
ncbi:MAG: hypothetical protein HYR94_13375 [Chloroflexi bacterium]|nr:hypothetical protein [Chloroflexota bacterium]